MGGDRSLVIMDIVVQTEGGSIINVEVQKHGYMFPGERAACYSADLLLRQYQRVRREASERMSEARKKGKKTADMFSYRDIRPVITIVFMESSTADFVGLFLRIIERCPTDIPSSFPCGSHARMSR